MGRRRQPEPIRKAIALHGHSADLDLNGVHYKVRWVTPCTKSLNCSWLLLRATLRLSARPRKDPVYGKDGPLMRVWLQRQGQHSRSG